MTNISVDLLTVARKINNFASDATGGGLWTSTTVYQVTVPVGKRWFLMGGNAQRDVSSTCVVTIHDTTPDIINTILNATAATGRCAWPGNTSSVTHQQVIHPFVLDAGESLKASFGTAQDTGAYASCTVLEIDI